jgi:non-heme chloroperoxidase
MGTITTNDGTENNPVPLPKSVVDDVQAQLPANRAESNRALPSGPFHGVNRPGVEPPEAIIQNRWRQGMLGGAITVPVLAMHGDDDQTVPDAGPGPLSAELGQNGMLKTYAGIPHGMPTTQAETINADLLAFIRS